MIEILNFFTTGDRFIALIVFMIVLSMCLEAVIRAWRKPRT